jgi:DNA-binding Lrp family transcriptional regulator
MPSLNKIVSPDPQKAVKRQKGGSTSKKLKALSHRKMVDQETGEIFDVGHVVIEERDSNFEKIWLGHVCEAIEEIGSRKIDVLLYLFRMRDNRNKVVAKIGEIAKGAGVSYDTVQRTLKALEESEVIKRGYGYLTLNPSVIWRGGHPQRLNVMVTYAEMGEEPAEVDMEARKAALLEQIARDIRKLGHGVEDFSDDLALEMLSRAMKKKRSDA